MDGRDMGGRDMDGQGVTPEAVRRRAFRSQWARQPGNDGRTRVRVPDDAPVTRSPTARPDAPALVLALEAHIATLKTDIERLTAELASERAAHQDQLATERAARQADREQLAAASAAADRATAELVELARRLAAIAETQTSAETAEAEPEPPRRSTLGRAWGWLLRN
jgi:hypothetical protein